MGRLWQTLILSQWRDLFLHIPVESLVYGQQQSYYQALNEGTQKSDSAPFIEFMLSIISEACLVGSVDQNDQVNDQVSDQVNRHLKVVENRQLSATELMEEI